MRSMFKEEEYVFFKTVVGAYVIGKCGNVDDKQVLIKKPVSIEFNEKFDQIGFLPYDAQYLDKALEEISFKYEHIMHVFNKEGEIPKAIYDKYLQYESKEFEQLKNAESDLDGSSEV